MKTIKFSDEFIAVAKTFHNKNKIPLNQLIENWAAIGRIAIDNPDLNYRHIQGILDGLADAAAGKIKKYKK